MTIWLLIICTLVAISVVGYDIGYHAKKIENKCKNCWPVTFKLTEEEKRRLANFPVGQGLFFAGQNHVHIQVIASETEEGLITTNPNATGGR